MKTVLMICLFNLIRLTCEHNVHFVDGMKDSAEGFKGLKLTFSPCNSDPCVLTVGEIMTEHIYLKARKDYDLTNGKIVVKAAIGDMNVTFIHPVCKYWHVMSEEADHGPCLAKKGQEYKYIYIKNTTSFPAGLLHAHVQMYLDGEKLMDVRTDLVFA